MKINNAINPVLDTDSDLNRLLRTMSIESVYCFNWVFSTCADDILEFALGADRGGPFERSNLAAIIKLRVENALGLSAEFAKQHSHSDCLFSNRLSDPVQHDSALEFCFTMCHAATSNIDFEQVAQALLMIIDESRASSK